MHVLPRVAELEERFGDDLVVIGVHAGKFAEERDTANIRQAVLRHEITHPVVNDTGFQIWQQFGVRAWPTLVLIDPAGNYAGTESGEIDADEFAPAIQRLHDYIIDNGYTQRGHHHEIYLSDPRRTAPERLKKMSALSGPASPSGSLFHTA